MATAPRAVSSRDDSAAAVATNFNVTMRGGAATATATTLVIEADAETSLPGLIEEVKSQLTADSRRLIADRIRKHEQAHAEQRAEEWAQALEQARRGWDGSPISTGPPPCGAMADHQGRGRLLLGRAVSPAGIRRSLGTWTNRTATWAARAPAAWATAHRKRSAPLSRQGRGRIVINVQTDGDLNYAPGVLWTAAHHQLPLLTIMHNNRAWHQELMFVHYMAGVRGRGTDRGHIGTR